MTHSLTATAQMVLSAGPSASPVLWEAVRMAGSIGQGCGRAGAPVAVERCGAAPGQAPAQGTGTLEHPSLEEQELEENSGWNRSRSWVSSSRAEPLPCLHCWFLLASGHQRPRPRAPFKLMTVAGAVQGESEQGRVMRSRSTRACLTPCKRHHLLPTADRHAGPRRPHGPVGSVRGRLGSGVRGPCPGVLGCCSCRASSQHGRPVSSRLPLPGRQPAAADT